MSTGSVADRIVAQLEEDGVVCRDGLTHRLTRRWRVQLARAAFQLRRAVGGAAYDPRVPIALALLDLYGEHLADELLGSFVELLLRLDVGDRERPESQPAHETADVARPGIATARPRVQAFRNSPRSARES